MSNDDNQYSQKNHLCNKDCTKQSVMYFTINVDDLKIFMKKFEELGTDIVDFKDELFAYHSNIRKVLLNIGDEL